MCEGMKPEHPEKPSWSRGECVWRAAALCGSERTTALPNTREPLNLPSLSPPVLPLPSASIHSPCPHYPSLCPLILLFTLSFISPLTFPSLPLSLPFYCLPTFPLLLPLTFLLPSFLLPSLTPSPSKLPHFPPIYVTLTPDGEQT